MTHDTAKQSLKDLERRLGDRFNESDELGVAVYETLGICSYIPDEGDPTKSLNTAVSLTERVLPGDLKAIMQSALDEWWSRPVFTAAEFPRFLCLACVRALIAQVPNPPEKERHERDA